MPLIYKHRAPEAPSSMGSLWGGGGKKTKEQTEKDKFSYMKDAMAYGKANKDMMHNPQVKETYLHMLEMAGLQPAMKEEQGKTITTPEGFRVGGPTNVTEDWSATYKMLQDRFTSEHKELLEPKTIETREGGVSGTKLFSPRPDITGVQSQFFPAQPRVMSPGSELVEETPAGARSMYRVKSEAERIGKGKPSWQVIPQDDGSYLIQDLTGFEKPSVVFPTSPVYERDPRMAERLTEMVDEAYEAAAADVADEIEAGTFKRGSRFWLLKETDEKFKERRDKLLEERFKYHLSNRGLTLKDIPRGWKSYAPATRGGGTTQAPTTQRKPGESIEEFLKRQANE